MKARDQTSPAFLRRELVSTVLARKVSYGAYLPTCAKDDGERLPTLFLLHGADGSFTDWPDHAHPMLERLSREHRIIVVVPDGGRDGWYLDSERLPEHRYASHLLTEIVPDVDSWLPTDGRRGIAGVSAGGNGALTLALTHLELFRCASSMSGVLDLCEARDRIALRNALGPCDDDPALWRSWSARHIIAGDPNAAKRLPMLITVGSADRWASANRVVAKELTTLGVPHVFHERDGGHDWSYWTSVLPAHVAFHAGVLNVA